MPIRKLRITAEADNFYLINESSGATILNYTKSHMSQTREEPCSEVGRKRVDKIKILLTVQNIAI